MIMKIVEYFLLVCCHFMRISNERSYHIHGFLFLGVFVQL